MKNIIKIFLLTLLFLIVIKVYYFYSTNPVFLVQTNFVNNTDKVKKDSINVIITIEDEIIYNKNISKSDMMAPDNVILEDKYIFNTVKISANHITTQTYFNSIITPWVYFQIEKDTIYIKKYFIPPTFQ